MNKTPFGPRAPLALAVFGVLAFVAYALLSTFAGDLGNGRDGGGHALSQSATGNAAIVTLLRASGEEVTVSRRAQTDYRAGLLVLTPAPGSDPKAVAKLIADRPMGTVTLVVLPKWVTAAQQDKPGWVWRTGTLDGAASLAPLRRWTPGAGTRVTQANGTSGRLYAPSIPVPGPSGQDATMSVIAPGNLHSIAGKGIKPVLADQFGAVVLGELQPGLYVLADPDIISNHGIRNIADARAAVAILRWLADGSDAGDIVFDVTLNGFGAGGRSLGRLALEPPFLGVTLCLLFAALLAALSALPRFGREQDEAPALDHGARTLIDNAADLVRVAGQEAAAAARYAGQVLERAALRARLPAGLSMAQQQARLGDGHDILTNDALAARGPGAALAAAQALYDWEERQSHARR